MLIRSRRDRCSVTCFLIDLFVDPIFVPTVTVTFNRCRSEHHVKAKLRDLWGHAATFPWGDRGAQRGEIRVDWRVDPGEPWMAVQAPRRAISASSSWMSPSPAHNQSWQRPQSSSTNLLQQQSELYIDMCRLFTKHVQSGKFHTQRETHLTLMHFFIGTDFCTSRAYWSDHRIKWDEPTKGDQI